MTGPKEDFILMVVGGLTLDPNTKMPIVVLKDPDNKLNLPIWKCFTAVKLQKRSR